MGKFIKGLLILFLLAILALCGSMVAVHHIRGDMVQAQQSDILYHQQQQH